MKAPHQIFDHIFAFRPNRETLGGTAYFIVEKTGNILLDAPFWDLGNQEFLQAHGGVRWLIFTHREGMGKQVYDIQAQLGCEIIIQQQEAYLLPDLKVTSFVEQLPLISHDTLIFWTPGHSPGSSCFYYPAHGGILFTGRHLLPNPQGKLVPIRTAKTFHWFRQINSVQSILNRFQPQNLNYVCPGAHIGYLRGQHTIANSYQLLSELDLKTLKSTEFILTKPEKPHFSGRMNGFPLNSNL